MRKRFANRAISLLLTIAILLGAMPLTVAAITISSKPNDGTVKSSSTNATVPFPYGTGGSNSFRIPAMVTLSDGTIVAAADARWNTTYDGGGLDTIVARSSDNGVTWNYTFANYLGDNGNENNASSTAFIDPALAVKTINDVETIFMLVDLYPHGVALNGGPDDYPGFDTGFDGNGNLLLSGDNHSNYNYYLGGTTIRSSDGSAVSGLNVDAYFNVTGTYNGTSYNTNLFFSDCPFQVARTGFLYLTTSTDKGATWSAPVLIPNLKTTSERVCLVGPGRGLVTTNANDSLPAGTIIFPVYSYTATSVANATGVEQYTGFIYSTDNGASWSRSTNFTGASWSSESAVVELSDGTLRFFYRNGTTNLCYVDYCNDAWGSAVNTGLDTNSNCQISAVTYSKTVDGQQVVLVSCPAGPNDAGSDQSGASYRKNGKIFIGLVNSDDNTISWQTDKTIAVSSVNSNDSFMYSCLTELSDGSVAILYEDLENDWGTADTDNDGLEAYYAMSFKTYASTELKLSLDSFGVFNDYSTSVTELSKTVTEGETVNVKYTGLGITETLSLSSLDSSVATASCSGNTITINAIGEGETTIIGTIASKSAVSALAIGDKFTINVTVEAAPVEAFFTEDGTNPVTALTIDMADGNVAVTLANVDAITSVSSSNTGVATVSFAGNEVTIDPVAEGSTVITATVGTMTYDLAVSVTATAEEEEPIGAYTITDSNSGVVITVDSPVLTSVSVTKKATANTPHTGYTACVTYDVVINSGAYTGTAQIKIPYDNAFDGCDTFIGDVGGETFAVNLVDGYFVGTVLHFSDVDINGLAEVTGEYSKTEDVILDVEGTAQYTLDGQQGTETTEAVTTANGVAQYTVTHNTTSTSESTTVTKQETLAAGTYKIGDGTNFLTFSDNTFGITTDAASATDFTIAVSGSTYTITCGSTSLGWNRTDNNYGLGTSYSYSFATNGNYSAWSYDGTNGFYSYLSAGTGLSSFAGSSNYYLKYDSGMVFSTGDNGLFAYTVTTIPGTEASTTTVSITGLQVGTTSFIVGDTLYNVTVNGVIVIHIYYQVDGVTVSNVDMTVQSDELVTLPDTVTVDGYTFKVVDTTLELISGINSYSVSLSGGKFITINYKHGDTVVKTETRVVEDNPSVTLSALEFIEDGTTYHAPETTLDLSSGTSTFTIDVYTLVGISICYQTPNGYVVYTDDTRTVQDNVNSLALDSTITANGKTYSVSNTTLTLDLDSKTEYSVTVDYLYETVTFSVDSVEIISDVTVYQLNLNNTIASALYDSSTHNLSITGLTAGNAGTVTANDTIYSFTVLDGIKVSVTVGTTLTVDLANETDENGFNLSLASGQYVSWSVSDSNYVGVTGKYTYSTASDGTTVASGTSAAYIGGNQVTESDSPVTVTATVYNSDGSIYGRYNWLVTVEAADVSDDVRTTYVRVDIDRLQNCYIYYSINAGPLIRVDETMLNVGDKGTSTEYYYLDLYLDEEYTNYDHGVNISFFATPKPGYSLSYMMSIDDDYSTGTENTNANTEYFSIDDGALDGTGTEAWPFTSVNQTTIPTSNTDSEWKLNSNGSCYGYAWALKEGNMTIEQWKIMISSAIELGCEGVMTFTKNTNGAQYRTNLSAVAHNLPTFKIEIESITWTKTVTNDDGTETTTSGTRTPLNNRWGIQLNDTVTYKLTMSFPAIEVKYGDITFSDIKICDYLVFGDSRIPFGELDGAAIKHEDGSTPAATDGYYSLTAAYDSIGSAFPIVLYASFPMTYNNYAKLYTDGSTEASIIVNEAELTYTYKTEYANTTKTYGSSAEIEAYIWYGSVVSDFGLPIEIPIKQINYLADVESFQKVSAKYGDIKQIDADNNGVTDALLYTPTSIAPEYDVIIYEAEPADESITNPFVYGIYVTNASNTLYEEGFMSANINGSGVQWSGGSKSINAGGDGYQSSLNAAPYGYDEEYKTSTGASGTQYMAELDATNRISDTLSFTFTGTGFDIIGACGPKTGTLMVRVDKVNDDGSTTYHKAYMVNTAFNDTTYGKIYQVPIVHADCSEDVASYTVTITGAYISYKTATANTLGFGNVGSSNAIADMYDLMYHVSLTDDQIDSVEFINMDHLYGISTYSDGETSVASDTTNTMTLEIDGFRVYRTTVNFSYGESVSIDGDTITVTGTEYDVTYYNALEAVLADNFAAYIVKDNSSATGYEVGNYESSGGPQNEIYLTPGQSVAFAVANKSPIQVSLRSVSASGTSASAIAGTSVNNYTIAHSTEMYYEVTPALGTDGDYYITITNTSDSNSDALLAIGNLKFAANTVAEQSTASYNAVFSLLRSGGSEITVPDSADDVILTLDRQWVNSRGVQVTELPSRKISAVYTMQNLLDAEYTVFLMVAAYNEDGKMLGIQMESTTLSALETDTLTATLTLPEGTTQAQAVLLGDDMHPLCSPMILPEND